MLWALLLVACFPAADSFACMVPPGELLTHYTNLIDRTATIVLADTIRTEEVSDTFGSLFRLRVPLVRYEFSVIETVKGRSAPKITLTFHGADWTAGGPIDHDFDRHRDPKFWDGNATRGGGIQADCRMNPVFFVGSRYLLFLEQPYHRRSFERITAADDRWLTTVRARVRDRSEFSQPVLQWLKEKAGLILYRVDRCATGDADGTTLTRLETLKDVDRFDLVFEPAWRPVFGSRPVFAGRRGCRPGQVVLAIFYGYNDPYVTMYPVSDGVIDVRLAETEIKLLGPRRVSIKELKAFLR